METLTRVPLPRPNRPILKMPPKRAARSRMPNKPIDLVFAISVRAIPRPLSFTSKLIQPPDSFKSTVT